MSTLETLTTLANALVKADENTDAAEKSFKEAKEAARVLREEHIPSVFHELGIDEIKLESGAKFKITQDVCSTLSAATKPAAYDWLVENGHGGLVKTVVSSTFGKGEEEDAVKLSEELVRLGLDSNLKRDVHAGTMKAWLKEQLADGTPPPMDLFGARPVFKATVKIPKPKKATKK